MSNIIRIHEHKWKDLEFNITGVGKALANFKIRYGLAVHGNYTMYLPERQVLLRWDDANAAERQLREEIDQLLAAIKSGG